MIEADITRWSPNFNNGPVLGRTVIIHSTRSGVSMNPSEFVGTLNYMSTAGTTSSQWVIGRSGVTARVVPDNKQAWHAGSDNDNAWGIELEQGVEADGFTADQLASLVEVCKGYMQDFAVPPVHATNSSQPGFIGHQETAQGKGSGKSDPGRLFDWGWFINALTEEPVVAPTEDQLRLAAVQAMLTKYNFKVTGTNVFKQVVLQLLEKDGTVAQPPSFIAVEVPK